jgi:glyoxylase-like metal-dependent hydrolase (beta-lactamase superfamily II)
MSTMSSESSQGANAGSPGLWEVVPLELGRRNAHHAMFFYLSNAAESIEIAYRAWLLRSASSLVLIDTGPPLDEAHRRGLRDVVPVSQSLRAHGIDAATIQQVILTHLHWDHAAGYSELPSARFTVQQAEADFFRGPAHEHEATSRFFSHRAELQALLDSGRCDFVDGDREICPGIRLIGVGGHTPGSQMVLVETAEGKALITGDAVPLARNYELGIPNGILVNLLDSIAALKKVRELKPALIYPGHDLVPLIHARPAPVPSD